MFSFVVQDKAQGKGIFKRSAAVRSIQTPSPETAQVWYLVFPVETADRKFLSDVMASVAVAFQLCNFKWRQKAKNNSWSSFNKGVKTIRHSKSTTQSLQLIVCQEARGLCTRRLRAASSFTLSDNFCVNHYFPIYYGNEAVIKNIEDPLPGLIITKLNKALFSGKNYSSW